MAASSAGLDLDESKLGLWTKLTLGCQIAQYDKRRLRTLSGEKKSMQFCSEIADQDSTTTLFRDLVVTISLIWATISRDLIISGSESEKGRGAAQV
jgi:hypothetical protein